MGAFGPPLSTIPSNMKKSKSTDPYREYEAYALSLRIQSVELAVRELLERLENLEISVSQYHRRPEGRRGIVSPPATLHGTDDVNTSITVDHRGIGVSEP
jgi:hypothetical protein